MRRRMPTDAPVIDDRERRIEQTPPQASTSRDGARFRPAAFVRALRDLIPPSRRPGEIPAPGSMSTTSLNKSGCLSSTLNNFTNAREGLVLPLS
jgi:hypothetical protein